MQMSGQMARRYGLPWRASNANACNARRAGGLGIGLLRRKLLRHANMIYHAAGWMEGGLRRASKFVIDCELLQQIIYTNRPVLMSADDLAVEAPTPLARLGISSAPTTPRYAIATPSTRR